MTACLQIKRSMHDNDLLLLYPCLMLRFCGTTQTHREMSASCSRSYTSWQQSRPSRGHQAPTNWTQLWQRCARRTYHTPLICACCLWAELMEYALPWPGALCNFCIMVCLTLALPSSADLPFSVTLQGLGEGLGGAAFGRFCCIFNRLLGRINRVYCKYQSQHCSITQVHGHAFKRFYMKYVMACM
jgi:hypothetical protein